MKGRRDIGEVFNLGSDVYIGKANFRACPGRQEQSVTFPEKIFADFPLFTSSQVISK